MNLRVRAHSRRRHSREFRFPNRLAPRAVLALSVLAAPLQARAGQASPIELRPIVLTGMQAPEQESGVVFAALTTPLNHTLLVPRLDDAGRVAFQATLAGPGVVVENAQSYWLFDGGGLRLIARGGIPARDTEPGVVFLGVPSLEVPFPPEFANGRAAFSASLTGPGVGISNDEGVWAGTPGDLRLLMREGAPAPGLPGVMFGIPGAVISDAGHTLVSSRLFGAGVDDTNDDSIWTDRSGTLALLLRTGQPAPMTEPGTVFGDTQNIGTAGVFRFVTFDDELNIAVSARVIGPDVDSFNDELLYVERGGSLQLLVREGDDVPGIPGNVTFGGNSVQFGLHFISLNNNGRVAFNANLGGSVPTQTAVFSDAGGALALVARPGQLAPGIGSNWSLFGLPLLNDADQLALTAALPDDDSDPFTQPPFGIWTDESGTLAPAVLPDDVTAEGELIDSVRAIGFNARGDLLISATLRGDSFRSGVLLRAGGALHRVAITGDLVDLSSDGEDVRQVLRVVPGALNEAGQVALRLDFTDESSAHFIASLAATGLAGDLDGDGDVDISDLGLLLADFNCVGGDCPGDVDGDGDTDVSDLGVLLSNFGM